jgi:hypothetical protein
MVHHRIHKIPHRFIYFSFKFPLHKCIYGRSSSACYMYVPSHFSICRSGARCRLQAVQPVILNSKRHGSHVVSRSVMPRFASIFVVTAMSHNWNTLRRDNEVMSVLCLS